MKSEVKLIGQNWKIHFTIGLFITILVIFMAVWFRFEFGLILLGIGGTIVTIGFVAVLNRASTVYYQHRLRSLETAMSIQQLRQITYEADKAEYSRYIHAFPKGQRLVTAIDAPIQVIDAPVEPVTNGLLPSGIDPDPLDLITVFTQPTQSYAIIGGQQTGKTYQARHIANYWLSHNIKPWVIGPKWDKGEWSGCRLFGGKGDFIAVERGISIVRQEAERRHASTELPHKDHSVLPVFFDDWTPIVDSVNNARQLVLEATTLYASVNITLYFVLHSDTANAWGVDRKGAALKDNFVKLFIMPHYDGNGLIVRDRTTAYIRFAGEGEDRPCKLINAPIVGYLESDDYINLEVEPNATEATILTLHEQGLSHAKICEQVWGYKSSNKYPEIDAVLAKFDAK